MSKNVVQSTAIPTIKGILKNPYPKSLFFSDHFFLSSILLVPIVIAMLPKNFSFKFGMSGQGSVSAVKRVSGKMDEEKSFDNIMEEQKVSFEGNVQFEVNVQFEAALQTGSETTLVEAEAPPAEPDAMFDAQF